MSDSVALNEVVRVLGQELGKEQERVVIGSTEVEKKVLEKHAGIGKRRAFIGFVGGSTLCAGAWKALGGQRRLLGALTVATGGMSGIMYGILSIRRDLLDRHLPSNPFYMEIKELLKKQQGESGSWDAVPSFDSFSAAPNRTDSDNVNSFPSAKRLPPLPPLDSDTNRIEDEPATPSSSPFFFGSRPTPDAPADLPPLSRDYRAPGRDSNSDPFYNSWDSDRRENDDSANKKPTTWEELRRRAAAAGK
ncbi:hypothetical protein P43SY_007722 [Pythium insidiosum]|uniref:Transmembrane protein n=1 Tax=Pythium insidiosum TaxID=114742 RepID=A0AAD5QD45_PYTIN|nr:hypothetical protein P43SY_007722 [Pythium insidiosum]